MNKTPIEYWLSLVYGDLSDAELLERVKDIYRQFPPSLAEMVVESFCTSKCRHCIYPPDFHKYNESLSENQWQQALSNLYSRLGLRTFIFSGRSLTRKIINLADYTKKRFPDSEVGIIGDSRDVEPLLSDIINVEPGWIDISLDGMANEHDRLRGTQGAFDQAYRVLTELKDSSPIPKVNILSCLTSENGNSIIDMISFLNSAGFKNFFISPVVIYESVRPPAELALSAEDFVQFLDNISARCSKLSDSYIEVNMYDVRYYSAIKRYQPLMAEQFTPGTCSLHFEHHAVDNELHVNYFPTSLAGNDELIINSNGDIIPPKIVAKGRVDTRFVAGNVLNIEEDQHYLERLVKNDILDFYFKELLWEREQLVN